MWANNSNRWIGASSMCYYGTRWEGPNSVSRFAELHSCSGYDPSPLTHPTGGLYSEHLRNEALRLWVLVLGVDVVEQKEDASERREVCSLVHGLSRLGA